MGDHSIFRRVIEKFAPSWYAMVMGTVGLSIVFYYASEVLNLFYWVGYGFFVFSVFIFVLFFVPWILRFFIAINNVKEDFYHPVKGSFFSTMPISMLLISFAMLLYKEHTFLGNSNDFVSLIIFWIGTFLVLVMGILVIVFLFFNEKIEVSHSNFAWFIPPVAHIIVTRVGLELLNVFPRTTMGEIVFWVSMFCLGIGLFMYIFLGSIVMYRYIFHQVPSGEMSPTTFIQLAPLGIFTTIFAKMLGIFGGANIGVFAMLSILFWSFGIWWLIVAVITLISHIKENKLPFGLSWWAFVFPLVAISLGTYSVSHLSSQGASVIFKGVFLFLGLSTFVVWFIVLFVTLKKVIKGEIF